MQEFTDSYFKVINNIIFFYENLKRMIWIDYTLVKFLLLYNLGSESMKMVSYNSSILF